MRSHAWIRRVVAKYQLTAMNAVRVFAEIVRSAIAKRDRLSSLVGVIGVHHAVVRVGRGERVPAELPAAQRRPATVAHTTRLVCWRERRMLMLHQRRGREKLLEEDGIEVGRSHRRRCLARFVCRRRVGLIARCCMTRVDQNGLVEGGDDSRGERGRQRWQRGRIVALQRGRGFSGCNRNGRDIAARRITGRIVMIVVLTAGVAGGTCWRLRRAELMRDVFGV